MYKTHLFIEVDTFIFNGFIGSTAAAAVTKVFYCQCQVASTSQLKEARSSFERRVDDDDDGPIGFQLLLHLKQCED